MVPAFGLILVFLCAALIILRSTHAGLRSWDERISRRFIIRSQAALEDGGVAVIVPLIKAWLQLRRFLLTGLIVAISIFIVLGLIGLLIFGIRQL